MRKSESVSRRLWSIDHRVLVYEDTPELLAFVVPFVRGGLAEGAACTYVLDDRTRAEVGGALAGEGVDVEREPARGALSLITPGEFYGGPPFDAFRALERVRARVRQATAAGFAGVRCAVEMTWTLDAGVGGDALATWESLLDAADAPGPLTLACLYHRSRFEPALLRRIIQNHATVIAGDHVYLSLSALFQNMARTDLQRFLASAAERHVAAGGFYFHQGEPATHLYVLTEGEVKLVRTDPDGRSTILRVAVPTEPFGHVGALGGTSRTASAQAVQDSRALAWDAAIVLGAMLTDPGLSLSAVRVLAHEMQRERYRAQDLATLPVEQRLARLLLRFVRSLGRKTPHGVAVRLALSGQDLAEMIGTTPYTVSRILAAWRREDIVDVRRGQIIVFDRRRLAAAAGLRRTGAAPTLRRRRPTRGG